MSKGFKFQVQLVKQISYILLLVAVSISLTGCLKDKSSHPQPDTREGFSYQNKEPQPPTNEEMLYPITDFEGNFFEVTGWISANEILYITENTVGSQVYLYDFTVGESRLFYESEAPIVNVLISPSKKHVLIHTAPFSYQGDLKIFTLDRSLQYETKIESFELAFAWNQQNEKKILVSAFNEDWSYSNYIIDINKKNISSVDLSQPFVVWPTEGEILYLDWETASPSLEAPLTIESIESRQKQELLPSAHYIDSSKQFIMIVQTQEENSDFANYIFMNKQFEQISKLDLPLLSTFSGWLVPFYEFVDLNQSIILFRPFKSGAADQYSEGFALTKFSLIDGKETVLFADLENRPLSCSLNGRYCLYGYQFEKLIDVKEKEIIDLIEH